jgi:hypothetical protein
MQFYKTAFITGSQHDGGKDETEGVFIKTSVKDHDLSKASIYR